MTPKDSEGIRFFHRRIDATTLVVVLALLLAVVFNLALLYPELSSGTVALNDGVLHLLLTNMAVDAITTGRNFTDPWQSTMNMGFPFFHYYQHLPHLSLALFHVATFESIPVIGLIRWTTYLLLSFFPLSIFWSLRLFGFDRITSAMGGLVASLAATDLLFGFGYSSYSFLGFGLFSQLWAMVLFPLAIAQGYRVLRDGRGYFWGTLLLAATLMSHLIYGYMAFITLGLLTLIPLFRLPESTALVQAILTQWKRLIGLLALVVVVTSYFLVPLFLDVSFVNDNEKLLPVFSDSFGYSVVLQTLFEGDLFDFRRFPSMTILIFAGIGLCVYRWREEKYLLPVGIFLMWLLFYFGRATWGPFIDLLPFIEFIHLHRFIAGVHLGGILLAAVALSAPWRWAVSSSKPRYIGAALIFTLLLMAPVYIDRVSYASENSFVVDENQRALAEEDQELNDLYRTLKQLPPGRVFAGPVGQAGQDRWGLDYKVGFVPMFTLLYSEGLDMMGDIYHHYSLPSDAVWAFDDSKQEQYDLFNVRYIVAPEGQELPDFAEPLRQFGRHQLYEVETTGYFDLVDSRMAFAGDRDDFNPASLSWLESGLPRAKQYPVVSLDGFQDVGSQLPLAEASSAISEVRISTARSRGGITSEEVGGNFFAAAVRVERDSTLLIKATYHPNWQATVDGEKADTFMVMPGFMGVRLASGDHQVRVEYQPRSFRLVLLVLGLVTLGLVLVVEKRGVVISGWLSTSPFARISNPLKMRQRPESGQERRRRRRQ